MTVGNGQFIQAVVDYVDAGGFHFQNKYTWLTDFTGSASEALVVGAIVTFVEDLYSELDAEILSTLEDPDVYVDELGWVVDHWEVISNVGSGVAGTTPTNGSEFLPYQCGATMIARTERPRSRGRKWMPPFGEDRQAGGILIGAAQTAMAAALVEYLADVTVSPGNLLTPGILRVGVELFLPFVAGFVGDLIGTQRRRVQGYGE